jgi:hypothetical protein
VDSPVVPPPSMPSSGNGIAHADAPKVQAGAPPGPDRGPRKTLLAQMIGLRHPRGRRSRYRPLFIIAVGVALVIFALAVPSASRVVLVVGGVAIVSGIATASSRLRDGAGGRR